MVGAPCVAGIWALVFMIHFSTPTGNPDLGTILSGIHGIPGALGTDRFSLLIMATIQETAGQETMKTKAAVDG
jgi:hypothetical protein